MDSLSCENVCCFYREAIIYGQNVVENACLKWLENNLMLNMKNFTLLKQIDAVLMTHILNSSNLFVLQVEMDIYTMLKKWLYLSVSTYDEQLLLESKTEKEISLIVQNHFRELFKRNEVFFLETEAGLFYKNTFSAVRFCNILRDFSCCLEVGRSCTAHNIKYCYLEL